MSRKAVVAISLSTMLFLLLAFSPNTFSEVDSRRGIGFSESPSSTDWWPTFHHDPSHTGYSTSEAPATNQTTWIYKAGGEVYSSPAVAGDKVYVGDERGYVYCLEAETGNLNGIYSTGRVDSSPTVVGDKVYVGSGSMHRLEPRLGGGGGGGGISCLDASTGDVNELYGTTGPVGSSPTVVGNKLYVGSQAWRHDPESDRDFTYGLIYCLDASTGDVNWTYPTDYPVISSPAVVGGRVYIGDEGGYVYCLEAATGNLSWKYRTNGWVDSSPAVGDGKVYVGSQDGNVYCLEAATGNLSWKYRTGSAVDSSPAVADGKIFVGSDDGNVYAFALKRVLTVSAEAGGTTRPEPATYDYYPPETTVKVAAVPNTRYFLDYWQLDGVNVGSVNPISVTMNSSHHLKAIFSLRSIVDWWPTFHHDPDHAGLSASMAPQTDNILWNYSRSGPVNSSPGVADGVVYVGSTDKNVYALNASTGGPIWNYLTNGAVKSSPAVAGGIVYVGSNDGYIYALNASTKDLVWKIQTGGQVVSSPAVADGIVYIGSADRNVYAFNASTGKPVWSYRTGDSVGSSPAVAYGVVYVGSYDNNVYALNAYTGAPVWSWKTGGSVLDSSPAIADGMVFIGSNDNNIYALNASDGTLVWKYRTGDQVLSSPAVADGIVFVGSEDGSIYAFGPLPFDVIVEARCITEIAEVHVLTAIDGSPTGNAPCTFWGLNGMHKFTVPNTDASGHKFSHWSTGETSTTATIDSDGIYVAYYEDMWPMFHHDPNQTGYSTSTAPRTNQTIWYRSIHSSVDSSPVVAYGMVYVGSTDNVYALDASTGAIVWRNVGLRTDYSPAVANGIVYIISEYCVYALNAFTGNLVWKSTDINAASDPVVDSMVFVCSCNDPRGGVCALNASTGDVEWEFVMDGPPSTTLSCPAIADGRVFMGSDNGNVYALNASTGARIWKYYVGFPMERSPTVADGRVCITASDQVFALDASTGALLWNPILSYILIDSSPAVAYGKVYVGSNDGNVYALDASTGIVAWSTHVTYDFLTSFPVVADGMVFVCPQTGPLCALNASTGNLLWDYSLYGMRYSCPAIADGRVFAKTWGMLCAFGFHDMAIANVTHKTVVGQNFAASISVSLANCGHFNETLKVSACANSSSLTGYKRPITITGKSGSILTNYQVLLTVDTASLILNNKTRPDCGDVRFKDSAGTDIPYWIESGINSTNTRIWVKVPTIPASGNTTVYMCYGNLTANRASNGTATFCFFDDFDGVSLNDTIWSVSHTGNAKATVSNGELVLSGSGTLSGDGVWVTLKSPQYWQGSYIIGARTRRNSALGESRTGLVWRVNQYGDWLGKEHWVYQNYYDTADVASLNMSDDAGRSQPSLARVLIDRTGVIGYIKRDYPNMSYYSVVNGVQQLWSLNEAANGGWTNLQDANIIGIGASNYYNNPSFEFRYDWFFVGKYVYPEPAISVGEETPAQEIASQTITLSNRNAITLNFTWNTAGFAKGNYTIWAYAWPVPAEADNQNNNFTSSTIVTVALPGDINNDHIVNMKDVSYLARRFGQSAEARTKPTEPQWDPNADINDDGKIDMKDISFTARHFGDIDP